MPNRGDDLAATIDAGPTGSGAVTLFAPDMASSDAVTLFGSVAFGASVFGERLSSGGARIAPALVGLGVALVGIVLRAGATPPRASEGVPRSTRSKRPRTARPDKAVTTLTHRSLDDPLRPVGGAL